MWFQNSVHVKAPLYVTRDLHLESTAEIDDGNRLSTAPSAEQGRESAATST